MSTSDLVLAVVAAVLVGVMIHRYARRADREIVYVDEGLASRTFVSERWGISAKPDALVRRAEGIVLIEYKSRAAKVYPSDIVQALAAALAVRDNGIRVVACEIRTRTGAPVRVPLPRSDRGIARRIGRPLADARRVHAGGVPQALASPAKCGSCGVREGCRFRQGRTR